MKLPPVKLALYLAALPFALSAAPISAQSRGNVATRPVFSGTYLRGEVNYRERILLPRTATLHVLVVKDLPGESGLPIGSAVIPARNGATPFQIAIPRSTISATGPFRVRTWIVSEGRVFMRSLAPSMEIPNFTQPVRITMGIVGANGQTGTGGIVAPAVQKEITGRVDKLDRRGVSPDAVVEIELRQVSPTGATLQIVSTKRIPLEGRQLPIEYALEVPASILSPDKSFVLDAKVIEGGRTSYRSSSPVDSGVIQQSINFRVTPAR